MPRYTEERQAADRRLKKAPPPYAFDLSPVTFNEMVRELQAQVIERTKATKRSQTNNHLLSAKKQDRKRMIYSEILKTIQRQHQGATPNGET